MRNFQRLTTVRPVCELRQQTILLPPKQRVGVCLRLSTLEHAYLHSYLA